MTRGVVTHDEGYILWSSEKLLNGLLPYRDFHFVYTPLSLFLTSLTFAILKPSILSSRLLMVIINLVTSWLIFKTVFLSTKNKIYATLALLIFVAWGPTHINFSWPVMYAIFTGTATCYLLMKFIETRREMYLFAAGIMTFTVFLSKQNFGVVMLFPLISFFIIKHARNLKFVLSFIYGYSWAFIFFVIYLLQTDSVGSFINDFYVFTIQRIVINSGLTTSFIYHDSVLNMVLRTGIYLVPIVLSLSSFVLLFIRRRFHLLFIPVFVSSFYIVGIRPTTDYIHLAPLMSLIGLPLALYFRYNIQTTVRIILFVFSFTFILLGFQTALFKGYYRWDSPLIEHNVFFKDPKVNIFLNEKFADEFKQLIEITNKNSREGDYILVDTYNPMIYFIIRRAEPTKHNFLSTGVSPAVYYNEVKGNLIAKKVKVIFMGNNALNALPIKNYIIKNYHFEKTIQDFDVYVRNP
jgi:hypothetical protein